ncbi:MAG: response regulator [Elusimicrobiota bacterium]
MNQKNKKILIVEDEKTLRNTYYRILKKEPVYDIKLAESAEVGLDFFNREKYDFIITDLDLPGMDGTDMIKEIKRKNPSVKVVVISGYADSGYMEEAIKSGAEEFISKPVDINKLRNTVSKYTK